MRRNLLKCSLALAAGILGLGFDSATLPKPALAVPVGILVLKGRVIDGTRAAPIEHGIVVIANGRV